MAPLRYAAKFDPFFSLDCAPTLPSTLAQSKERKGSNFAIWQPCSQEVDQSGPTDEWKEGAETACTHKQTNATAAVAESKLSLAHVPFTVDLTS